MEHRNRAVTPVVATILLVAAVIVIAASIGAVTLGFGDRMSTPAPTVGFESEIGENITIRHTGGDTITLSEIEVRGGTVVSIPDQIRSGDAIEIDPDSDADEVEVVWISGERSAVLYSVDTPQRDDSESEPTGPEPSPPPECSGVVYVSTDSSSVINAGGDSVVIEAGVTQSGNINNPGDVFLRQDATMTEPVGSSGEIVLEEGATIQNNVNSGDNLYLLPDSKITGTVCVSGTIYLEAASQIDGNVNCGTIVVEYE